MSRLAKYLFLPQETTEVELQHVRMINSIAMKVCWLHLPLFLCVAWLCDTSMVQALGFGSFLALGPTLANRYLNNPRTLSLFFGFTAMCLGALLVHLGQGPVQIEMHFYFFAALALLTVWGNPLIIWVAAVTVALHHALFWMFWPKSVFNYEAQIWVVAVHAAFVVAESVAAAFIARNFYDNVIGLEKIVKARTKEITDILDNVSFGMFITNKNLTVQQGYSRSCLELFAISDGALAGRHLSDLLSLSKRDKENFEGLYEQIFDENGLEEFAISQLPTRFFLQKAGEEKVYGLKGSLIRNTAGKVAAVMFCISDDTSLVKAESDVQLSKSLLKIVSERNRFKVFAHEIHSSFQELRKTLQLGVNAEKTARSVLHTMKGGFGVYGLSDLVHETHSAESAVPLQISEIDKIENSFRKLIESNDQLLNLKYGAEKDQGSVEIPKIELEQVLQSMRKLPEKDCADLAREFLESSLLPTASDILGPIDELTRQLAGRFGKRVQLKLAGADMRVPLKFRQFLLTMNHLVRNAVDHGIETPSNRKHKPATAQIELLLTRNEHEFVLVFKDDGAGIDTEAVRKQAIAKGLLDPLRAKNASPAELHRLIFEPGFSTAQFVNDVSGRGIGMSAVKTETDKLGGTVLILSEQGKGTTIEFRIPFAVSEIKAAA